MHSVKKSESILEGLRRGDREVLNGLYRDHYYMIQSFINKNGPIIEAKELLHESIMVLWRKSHDPKFELSCAVSTYLYAVCKNLYRNKSKASIRSMTVDQVGGDSLGAKGEDRFSDSIEDDLEMIHVPKPIEESIENDAIEYFESAERRKRIQKYLTAVGDSCRKILEFYYLLEMSMKEIAVELGYTNDENVKNQKYRCLKKLRELTSTK